MKPYKKTATLLIGVLFPTMAYCWTASCTDSDPALSQNKTYIDRICSTIKNGRNILSGMGLTLPEQITINASNTIPDYNLCQLKCIGVFDTKTNEIHLLDYESASRLSQQSPLFINEKMGTDLWESYVIHELTHAAVQYSKNPETSLCIASEYIAAVAQMESLSPGEREKILHNYKELSGFDQLEEINLTYYLMAPGKFIVKAYKHYLREENGPTFIKKILRDGLSCHIP